MRTERYQDASARLHRTLERTGRPAFFQFELTHRCDLRCRHCYLPQSWLAGSQADRELPTRAVRKIVDQVANLGAQWVSFTGGNPLLRHDFFEILGHARQRGLLVSVLTTLPSLDARTCRRLCDLAPFSVEVTLNSLDAVRLDRMTRTSGALRAAVAGLENARAAGLPLKVKTKVLTTNREELPAIRRFLVQYGLGFYPSTQVSPTLTGGRTPLRFRLPPKAAARLAGSESERRRMAAPPRPGRTDYYACGVGTWTYHIDPAGWLLPCLLERSFARDLRRESLVDAIRSLRAELARRQETGRSPCQSCARRILCAWCPAKARLETRSPGARVPYLCAYARAAEPAWTAAGRQSRLRQKA